jgi:hypothetical protein
MIRVLKNIRTYLLLSGLFLSSAAAYYSIAGLIAIFPGATTPILLMGGSLEFAKIVTATYLYKSGKSITLFMRIYMTIAVVILMFITSMGVFGFLSKAHIENNINRSADVDAVVVELQSDIKADEKIVADADKQLNLLDNTVKEDYNIILSQKRTRTALTNEKKEATKRLRENNKKLAEAQLQVEKNEVDIGPLKYIAELIYGQNAKSHFDDAVRLVIILIVIVFDPLAVMLLIAATKRNVDDGESFVVTEDDFLNLEKEDL